MNLLFQEERVEEKKRNRDLKIQLRKEQMKNADRKRKEIAAAEAMGNAQVRVATSHGAPIAQIASG